jgi:hypothetical protein
VKEVVGQPQADSPGAQGVVWDHAAFHQAKAVGEGGRPTLLNPAKRVFAEVRRWVEGRRYKRIEAKKAAIEEVLRWLEAEGKVSLLVEWRYIRQALNALLSWLRSCVFRNGIRVGTPILLPFPYLYPHAANPHRGHGGVHSGQTGFYSPARTY